MLSGSASFIAVNQEISQFCVISPVEIHLMKVATLEIGIKAASSTKTSATWMKSEPDINTGFSCMNLLGGLFSWCLVNVKTHSYTICCILCLKAMSNGKAYLSISSPDSVMHMIILVSCCCRMNLIHRTYAITTHIASGLRRISLVAPNCILTYWSLGNVNAVKIYNLVLYSLISSDLFMMIPSDTCYWTLLIMSKPCSM